MNTAGVTAYLGSFSNADSTTDPSRTKIAAPEPLPTPRSFTEKIAVSGQVDLSCQSTGDQFSQAPPQPVMKSLTDVFFANCHNQPYSFFHEAQMRLRIGAGEVPQYLLLAIAATASRYSSHAYFKGCQMEAGEAMSKASWSIIINQVFAVDTAPEIAAVQAIAMLAVIDFTGVLRLSIVLLPCVLE